jgi:ankyrin repeat protein
MWAAANGQLDVVKDLHRAGADVSPRAGGWTLLHVAASAGQFWKSAHLILTQSTWPLSLSGQEKVLTYLLGVLPSAITRRNDYGKSAEDLAVANGQSAIAAELQRIREIRKPCVCVWACTSVP